MSRIFIPLVFGLAGAAILVWLGLWQVQRLDWKQDILSEIDETISGPPINIPTVPTEAEHRYKPVELSGTIESDELFVLISLKQIGAGFRVISAFETSGGRRVLLDRGFVPVDQKPGIRRNGPAKVVANLHWPDERNSSTPANDVDGNTWFARDLDQMADLLGTEPVLIVARSETPGDRSLKPVPVDSNGIPNDHLNYAITWFSLALVWIAMTGAFLWRSRKTKEGYGP